VQQARSGRLALQVRLVQLVLLALKVLLDLKEQLVQLELTEYLEFTAMDLRVLDRLHQI